MGWFFDEFGRMGFGFSNPNHAAALICAVLPLVWGRGRGAGRIAVNVLTLLFVAALVATGSRTGLLVLAVECAAWRWLRGRRLGLQWLWWMFSVAGLIVGMGLWRRFTLDDSIMNRPLIWLAGLKLIAANPFGVGCGHSGEIASAWLLDGLPVRSLVSAHLTLAAEFGWGVFAVWCAGVCGALSALPRAPRAGIVFGGLVLSAATATVFDWAVLFTGPDYFVLGWTNFVLAWMLLLLFIACGTWLFSRGVRRSFRGTVIGGAITLVLLCAFLSLRDLTVPRVQGEYAITGGTEVPTVFYDETWDLRNLVPRLPDGCRIRLCPGVPETLDHTPREVILFGDCAESAHRFPSAQVKVVAPPEFR